MVGTGLQVMQAMFDADGAAVAGPRGKHDPARGAGRHGCGPGSVTLGGRRLPVTRPRVRAANGSGELPVPSEEVFTSTEMLGGLSTRRYGLGLEPVGEQVTETAKGTSKSAISGRFVQRTETTLAELLTRPLGELDLIALMVDRVHFGEHLCVVALGIDADGSKHPLALVEGSTENTATVRGLLVGLRDRGLDVARPLLVVIDGAKALTKAAKEIFDAPMIQRCQLHKIRNVRDHLPERLRGPVESRMRRAYHAHAALRRGAAARPR